MLALELGKMLNCDVLKIKEVKNRIGFSIFLDVLFNRTPRIQDHGRQINEYDHIILVAPIWASKIASPLKSFLLLEKNNIRRYSFISVCAGSRDQKTKIESELLRLVGKRPVVTTELWINDILPEEKKNKIKYVTSYHLKAGDLSAFATEIMKHTEMAPEKLYHH
jgi:hypothetical protein